MAVVPNRQRPHSSRSEGRRAIPERWMTASGNGGNNGDDDDNDDDDDSGSELFYDAQESVASLPLAAEMLMDLDQSRDNGKENDDYDYSDIDLEDHPDMDAEDWDKMSVQGSAILSGSRMEERGKASGSVPHSQLLAEPGRESISQDDVAVDALHELTSPVKGSGVVSCDFVFVPGIYGHHKRTWCYPTGDAEEAGTFWPLDVLCRDFAPVRVFSYSYKRPDFTAGHSESLWEEIAEDLVHKVSLKRQNPAHASTPIIWIAHSLGGFIAKAALVFAENRRNIGLDSANISISTAGMMFFSTPHSALTLPGWEAVLGRIAAAANPPFSRSPSVERNINVSSRMVGRLNHLLSHFFGTLGHQRISVYSFYETRPTLGSRVPVVITNKENALGLATEKVRYLNGNHFTMCKFHSSSDENYLTVKQAISDILYRPQNYNPQLRIRSARLYLLPNKTGIAGDEESLEGRSISVISISSRLRNTAQNTTPSATSLPHAAILARIKRHLRVGLWRHKAPIPEKLDGTLNWILHEPEFHEWLESGRFLLITGPAGSGKSVAANFILRHLQSEISQPIRFERRQSYVLSFFFSSQTSLEGAEGEMLAHFLLQLLEINELLVRHFEDKKWVVDPTTTTGGGKRHRHVEVESPTALQPASATSLFPPQPDTAGYHHEPVSSGEPSSNQVPRHDTFSSTDSGDSALLQASIPAFEVEELASILNSVLNDEEVAACHFVIDGLDECSDEALLVLMGLLQKFKNTPKVKVCLTHRSNTKVKKTIGKYLAQDDGSHTLSYHQDKKSKRIHEIQLHGRKTMDCVRLDLECFTKSRLEYVARENQIPDSKFSEIRALLKGAKTFSWVSLNTGIFANLPNVQSINNLISFARTNENNLTRLYEWAFDFLIGRSEQLPVLALCFVALAKRTMHLEDLAVLLAVSTTDQHTPDAPPPPEKSAVAALWRTIFPRLTRLDTIKTVESLEQAVRLDLGHWLSTELLGLVQVTGNVVTLTHASLRDFLLGRPTSSVPEEARMEGQGLNVAELSAKEVIGVSTEENSPTEKENPPRTQGNEAEGAEKSPSGYLAKHQLYQLVSYTMAWASLLLLQLGCGKDHRCTLGIAGWDKYFNRRRYRTYALQSWADHAREAAEMGRELYPALQNAWNAMEPEHRAAEILHAAQRPYVPGQRLSLSAVIAALDLPFVLTQADVEGLLPTRTSSRGVLSLEIELAVRNSSFCTFKALENLGYGFRGRKTITGHNVMDLANLTEDRAFVQQMYDLTKMMPSKSYFIILGNKEGQITQNSWRPHAKEIFRFAVHTHNVVDVDRILHHPELLDAAVASLGLNDAVDKQHEDIVRLILQRLGKNPQFGVRGLRLGRAVATAAKRDNIGIARLLLEHGADCNERDDSPEKATALHYSARCGDVELVRELLGRGAATSVEDQNKQKPLHWASRRGHAQVLRYLVSSSEMTARDRKGRNPLHLASKSGSMESVRLLLRSGALINERDDEGRTPLQVAAGRGTLDVVRILIAKGPDINARSKTGNTALHEAAHHGFDHIVSELLAYNADPRIGDGRGHTPLHHAARTRLQDNVLPMAQMLVEAGADPQAVDVDGRLALHYAAELGNISLVRFLFTKSPWKAQDERRRTALHYAASKGHVLTSAYLLEAGFGADRTLLNLRDDEGCIALHLAAGSGSLPVVEAFLKHHSAADVALTDDKGRTVVDVAKELPNSDRLVEVLQRYNSTRKSHKK